MCIRDRLRGTEEVRGDPVPKQDDQKMFLMKTTEKGNAVGLHLADSGTETSEELWMTHIYR